MRDPVGFVEALSYTSELEVGSPHQQMSVTHYTKEDITESKSIANFGAQSHDHCEVCVVVGIFSRFFSSRFFSPKFQITYFPALRSAPSGWPFLVHLLQM